MIQEDDPCPILQPYEDEYSARLARINKLADFLDSKFVIPGTSIRFGWDGIIGLIPVVGDTLTLLPQLYLLYEAYRTKVGAWTILKMLANVGIDWLIGAIPVVGDIFDVAFRSNLYNVRLVAQRIREKQALDI
ncbi:MAG: DUF4112 domain-containing protein [Verrucomicrobia bacterium]|nr:DUF4112 domain-containing protein [Verrucomicrobiota bacterium]